MNILIIDDDKDVLAGLKSILESKDFKVDTAKDGLEGLKMVKNKEYELLILDLNLPKKDGAEVCREIRALGKNLPILILSVKSELDDKINLFNIGADDYLTKPFSTAELLSRIRALLRRNRE